MRIDIDQEYVKKTKKGDKASLSFLYNKYLNEIYDRFYCRLKKDNKEDANDLTSETFLRMVKNIKDFKENSLFKTWLYGISNIVFKEYLRKIQPKLKFGDTEIKVEFQSIDKPIILKSGEETSVAEVLSSNDPPFDEILIDRERKERIRKATENLTRKQVAVLELSYFKDLSYKEIAKKLNTTEPAVKMLLSRALDALKKEITSSHNPKLN